MRRPALFIVALMLGLAIQFGGTPALRGAQDATPGAAPKWGTDVEVEYLSNGAPAAAGNNTLELVRITFLASGVLDSFTHPGGALVYVDQGTVTISVTGGQVTLLRNEPAALGPVEDLAGCSPSCTLNVGDSLVLVDGVTLEITNPSSFDTAVLMVASLTPVPAPPAPPGPGTPAATPAAGPRIHPMGCDKGC